MGLAAIVVDVVADHVAAVVDAGGQRVPGAGEVDPGDGTAESHEAAHPGAVVDQPRVLAVPADDLAAVVDLGRLGRLRARHVERGEPAVRAADEPRLAVVADVLARDLALVVDPARIDRHVGLWGREGRVLPVAEQEARQRCAPGGDVVGRVVQGPRGRRAGRDETHRDGERHDRGDAPHAAATDARALAAEPPHDGFPPDRCLRSEGLFGAVDRDGSCGSGTRGRQAAAAMPRIIRLTSSRCPPLPMTRAR